MKKKRFITEFTYDGSEPFYSMIIDVDPIGYRAVEICHSKYPEITKTQFDYCIKTSHQNYDQFLEMVNSFKAINEQEKLLTKVSKHAKKTGKVL